MRFGVGIFFTDYSAEPGELAKELEARGFESIWAPEHSHIPISRATPMPAGKDLPKKYYDVMDPFVSLTAAAVGTTTLKVATGICLVGQRDPIQTAKLVSSLDQVSSGRFMFGIGSGWNAEEMANHGTNFQSRHKRVRESIAAIRKIWTSTKPEYHADLIDFPPMMTWPKPVQDPHPPIHVGGSFPHGARRAIAYGNGWMPHIRRPNYEDVTEFLPDFEKMARESGRDIASLPVSIWDTPPEINTVKRFQDRGVTRVIAELDSQRLDALMPELDLWAEIIHRI